MFTRTHLKNTSARDMSQFPQDQGATTSEYWTYSEEEPTMGLRVWPISLWVAVIFPYRLRCGSVAVTRYSFLAAPCGYGKIPRNAGWMYF